MQKTSPSEEKLLWGEWTNTQDPDVCNSLVRVYLPLVHYQVQRIAVTIPKNISRDELTSFGMMGLYDAITKFDPTRDLKFDTYASFRIRGAIIDGLRKEDWLSRTTRERVKKVESTIELLEQRLSRSVRIEDISQELGMEEEVVQTSIIDMLYSNVLSIDDNNKEDLGADGFKQNLKDEKQLQPEAYLLKGELLEDLARSITILNEKEQYVISMFYKEELTFTEIGHVLGVSTSRISQIHAKAILKLKDKLIKTMD